jgi:glutaredoxin
MIYIYYLKYCPHSQKALQTLDKYKINHHKIESSDNKEERKQYYPTFPQIYWSNNLVGGNDKFTNIIMTLQSNTIPSKQEEWSKREWYKFLLNIAVKLK